MRLKTKVIKHGAFWRVQILKFGVWQTMRDLYPTRARAREMRYWWAA